MPVIRGSEALQAFRAKWTGAHMLELIKEHDGRLRVELPVGVGKSTNIDQTAEAALSTNRYDLVIILTPTRQVIQERSLITHPRNVGVVNLKPRPRNRCRELDPEWQILERNGLGALGRRRLCNRCPRYQGCFWPGQYGKKLRGTRVTPKKNT